MEKFNGIEYVKKNIEKLKNLSIEELALYFYDIDRNDIDINYFASEMIKLLGDNRREEIENFCFSDKVISVYNFKLKDFSFNIKDYLTDNRYKKIIISGILHEIKVKEGIDNFDFGRLMPEKINALPFDILVKDEILSFFKHNQYILNYGTLNLNNFDPKLVKKVKNKIRIIENNYRTKESLEKIKEFVSDNPQVPIICVAATITITGMIWGFSAFHHLKCVDVSYEQNIDLTESNVDLTDGYYEENNFDTIKLNDVFLVYNIDNHYSCYRKLVGYDQQYISHVYSTQAVLDRVEIYEYYDLQTGEKVCQTGDEGYFYEPIINYINLSDIMDLDYEVTAEQLNQMIEHSDMMEGNNRFDFR